MASDDRSLAELQREVEHAERLCTALVVCHHRIMDLLHQRDIQTARQLLSPDGIPDEAARILADRGPLRAWDIFEALGQRERYRFTSQPLSVIANRLKVDAAGRFVYDKRTKRWALLGEGDGAAREG